MDLLELADDVATRYGIDPVLFRRLIMKESRFNPDARSSAGAEGIAQIMPRTAAGPGYGVAPIEDPYDVEAALEFSAQYFTAMLDKYGNERDALVAYNWGPGNTDTWLETGVGMKGQAIPPETTGYFASILGDQPIGKPGEEAYIDAQGRMFSADGTLIGDAPYRGEGASASYQWSSKSVPDQAAELAPYVDDGLKTGVFSNLFGARSSDQGSGLDTAMGKIQAAVSSGELSESEGLRLMLQAEDHFNREPMGADMSDFLKNIAAAPEPVGQLRANVERGTGGSGTSATKRLGLESLFLPLI